MPTTTNKNEHLIQPPVSGRNMQGWGVDTPANRPAVPKEKPSTVMTPRGAMPARQPMRMKVFKSTEHPDMPPVFGTSCPPRGLSGKLREVAFQYSEGQMTHWLTLMLADRVNVIERAVIDALHGKPDHYIDEKGWKAKLKYDDGANLRRAVTVGACVIGAVALGVAVSRRR